MENNQKSPQVAGTTSEESGSFVKTNIATFQLKHGICSRLTLDISILTDGSKINYAQEILAEVERILEEKFNH